MIKLIIITAVMFIAAIPALCGEYLGDLGEVLVTPSGGRMPVYRWPGSVTVLTPEDISASGAGTVDEVFAQLTGVSVSNLTGASGRSVVDIRGMGEEAHLRSLVLVDGRRLNRPDMGGMNWLEIPAGSVERIEVIRGGSGVMYGSSAMGGVINIITRRPAEKKESFTVEAGAGSFGLFRQRAGYSASGERLGISFSAERFSEEGYRSRSLAFSEGVSVSLSDSGFTGRGTASLGVSFSDSSYEMPGSLTREQMREDPRQHSNDEDQASEKLQEISADISLPLNDNMEMIIRSGYSRRREEVDMSSWFSFSDRDTGRVYFLPELRAEPAILNMPLYLMAGGGIYRESLDADLYSDPGRDTLISRTGIRMPVAGGWIRGEAEPAAGVILSAGYRSERAEITVTQGSGAADGRSRHRADAFELGGVWIPVSGVKTYLSFGSNYRYPAVDEQASYQGFGDDFFAELGPEEGFSGEAGISLSAVRGVAVEVSAYRSVIRDMISWDGTLLRNVNMDEVRRDGLEAGVRAELPGSVRLRAGAALGETLFRKGPYRGSRMPLTPGYEWKASVSAGILGAARVNLDAVYTGKRYAGGDYANLGEMLKGYTVLNAGTVLRSGAGLEVQAGVKNILNESYAVSRWGGWYPAPERSLYFSVRAGF